MYPVYRKKGVCAHAVDTAAKTCYCFALLSCIGGVVASVFAAREHFHNHNDHQRDVYLIWFGIGEGAALALALGGVFLKCLRRTCCPRPEEIHVYDPLRFTAAQVLGVPPGTLKV